MHEWSDIFVPNFKHCVKVIIKKPVFFHEFFRREKWNQFLVWHVRFNMRLIILEEDRLVGDWAAKYVVKRINEFKPNQDKYFVLGLPTGKFSICFIDFCWFFECLGSTPLKMYAKLVEYYKAGKVSFKYVKTFNMDEYVGLPRDHPESYHHFMFHNLFKVNNFDVIDSDSSYENLDF